MDSQNRIVIYHGLNVANRSKSSSGKIPQVTPGEYEQVREWGFNLVRYLVFWEVIEPEPGQVDGKFLARTWQEIDLISAAGLEVVIDFHQDLQKHLVPRHRADESTPADSRRSHCHVGTKKIL